MPLSEFEEDLQLEREVLLISLRRGKLEANVPDRRASSFWSRAEQYLEEDALRLEAQRHVWAEQRSLHEQALLQPLSTSVAELRRWQGVQRAAHEQKCLQVRNRREHEEGSLQWAIFCARLAHDSFGALIATPLAAEQVRHCDTAAAAQLQPRTKSGKEATRQFTVVRAAAISVARGFGSVSGPVSARSTRGLPCSELCQTREQFERLLSRVLSGVLVAAESSAGPTELGQVVGGTGAGDKADRAPASPSPAAERSQRRGAGKDGGGGGRGTPVNGSAAATRPGATPPAHGKSERVSSPGPPGERGEATGHYADARLDLSSVTPAALVPPGKRMPLFPRAMRLSSDCLGWLHASQRSASDMHVYFLAEEMDAPPVAQHRMRMHGGGARRPAPEGHSIRSLASGLSTSAEVNAVSMAGADLRVLLPDSMTGGSGSGSGGGSAGLEGASDSFPALHLRPASVEHLLAVECLWTRMDPADRQVLNSCYTPRDAQHTCRLGTLFIPLSDGPHAEVDGEMGQVRRLRPLRPPELMELMRIYVVRQPQPAAATLALPLAPANDERAAELRTSPGDEVLQHVYCVLGSVGQSGGGGGGGAVGAAGSQCFVLQMQMSPAASTDAPLHDEAPSTPPLVNLCQSGALRDALSTVVHLPLRHSGLVHPNLARQVMESGLSAAQKTVAAQADLQSALRKQLLERVQRDAAPSGPAEAVRESARGVRSPGRPKKAHGSVQVV